MAWGYWTTYSTYSVRQPGQENHQAPSAPLKLECSVESKEHEQLAQVDSNHRLQGSGVGGARLVLKPYQSDHVEGEKVAFERKLLLGEPDWSSRTIADRNTLPKKKPFDYERTSTSEALYIKNGHSPTATPIGSVSRKSDDIFCPACAQHSTCQQSSNRDSRVSFGSVASSSRGSSSAREGSAAVTIPIRSRSHDEDERPSCMQHRSNGGHIRGQTAHFSSSLPPPFSSQNDILHHQSSFMETINQKISILSSFRPKFHFMSNTATADDSHNYPKQTQNHNQNHKQSHPHHSQRFACHEEVQHHHKPPGQLVRPSSGDHILSNNVGRSSSSLQDSRCRMNGGVQHKSISQTTSRSTSRKSARKSSSGSRTPRGHSGSASSRRSRESIGSYEKKLIISSNSGYTSGRQRSSSERDDDYGEDRDGGDEESDDVDNNNFGKNEGGRRSLVGNLPKDPPPLYKEPLEKLSARQSVYVSGLSSSLSSKAKLVNPISRNSKDFEIDAKNCSEDFGTIKRFIKGKAEDSPHPSTECGRILESGPSRDPCPMTGSLRSSQSQTPDDEDSAMNLIEARRMSCKRHGGNKLKDKSRFEESSKPSSVTPSTVTNSAPYSDQLPFTTIIKKSNGNGSKSSSGSTSIQHHQQQQPSQAFRHFKHYDHNQCPTTSTGTNPTSKQDSKKMEVAKNIVPRRGDECCRPRSASMGNHLSDADTDSTKNYHTLSAYPHQRDDHRTNRRHLTLDGYGQGDR